MVDKHAVVNGAVSQQDRLQALVLTDREALSLGQGSGGTQELPLTAGPKLCEPQMEPCESSDCSLFRSLLPFFLGAREDGGGGEEWTLSCPVFTHTPEENSGQLILAPVLLDTAPVRGNYGLRAPQANSDLSELHLTQRFLLSLSLNPH